MAVELPKNLPSGVSVDEQSGYFLVHGRGKKDMGGGWIFVNVQQCREGSHSDLRVNIDLTPLGLGKVVSWLKWKQYDYSGGLKVDDWEGNREKLPPPTSTAPPQYKPKDDIPF